MPHQPGIGKHYTSMEGKRSQRVVSLGPIIFITIICNYYSQEWQFYYFCLPMDFEKLKERDHVLPVLVNQCLADVMVPRAC